MRADILAHFGVGQEPLACVICQANPHWELLDQCGQAGLIGAHAVEEARSLNCQRGPICKLLQKALVFQCVREVCHRP